MNISLTEQIFQNHYKCYDNTVVEITKQQAATFKQVSEAYQGRVIFELLQNAIDKAESKILTSIVEIEKQYYLLVANDGENFTYNSLYDYEHGGKQRYDFQSLCSIATSTKDSTKFIGNKGVGFKSVFSINDYADIYTRGRILPEDEIYDIDFRVYNQFNTEELLVNNGLYTAKDKLKSVQLENDTWGIPGYYYPIKKDPGQRPELIDELLSDGFVTVVSVPIPREKYDTVVKKINNIKKYHFHFISEKHQDKNIDITLKILDETIHSTRTATNSRVVSKSVSEKTRELAKGIGLKLSEDAKVSLFFKDSMEKEGVLYNFMPTELSSPIPYVDINADFQTSVDRKNIVLSNSNDERIGKYNHELLFECIALYKQCLYSTELLSNEIFEPYHLIIKNTGEYETIQLLSDVFQHNFASLVVSKIIAVRSLGSEPANYNYFYRDFLLRLVRYFHPYNHDWGNYSNLVQECGEAIRKTKAKFLPDIEGDNDNKIFLSFNNSNISIPRQIKAEISGFTFEYVEYDYGLHGREMLKKGLGLSEYEQSDEIFRLYRQCRNDGIYRTEESLTEDEQTGLLASICNLIKNEHYKDIYECSTWRFSPIIKALSESRDITARGRAGVALSSLFFKTKNGKYKPSQLLHKDEIGQDFIDAIIAKCNDTDFDIDVLLRRVGVSFNKYLYADSRLEKSIREGLDFIPAIINEPNPKNVYIDILLNVRVMDGKEMKLHPMWINENYTSLFAGVGMNEELRTLRAGKYDMMPREYATCLKSYLSNKCTEASKNRFLANELLRFYQKNFENLYKSDIVLIKDRDSFKIADSNSTFIIVANRWFLECQNSPVPLLCYVSEQGKLDVELQARFRHLTVRYDDRIHDEPEKGLNVANVLKDPETVARLLCQIFSSRLSDSSFEDSNNSLTKVLNQINLIDVQERIALNTTCSIENEIEWKTSFEMPFFYDKESNILYVEVNDSEVERSHNIVSKAIANTIFHNEGLTHLIESTLFYNSYVDPLHVMEMKHRIQEPSQEFSESYEIKNYFEYVRDDKATDSPIDWDDVPDYDIIGFDQQTSADVVNSPSQNTSGTAAKKPKGVSDGMIQTGTLGEMIVVKNIALQFMHDYGVEERVAAIKMINDFLIKEKYDPIITEESTLRYESLSDIIELLWYTHHPNYQSSPFDIVTMQDEQVVLIEVKSTDGKDNFRLSCRETKVATRYSNNYKIYRVSNNDHGIRIIGNPMKDFHVSNDNKSFTLTPAGFFVKLNPL